MTCTLLRTSFFQRPPGVGAKLEKGAPPPFDPPDLVPRFARPNPELASLAQPSFALPGIVSLFCHLRVLLASWRYAPLRIPPSGAFVYLKIMVWSIGPNQPAGALTDQTAHISHQGATGPMCQNQPIGGAPSPICPNQPPGVAPRPIYLNKVTRGCSWANPPNPATRGRSQANLPKSATGVPSGPFACIKQENILKVAGLK